jgi:hypothetical protein
MEPEEILHEIRDEIREKFDNDIYIMRTVNMVVLEFERRNKQLKQHGVMQGLQTQNDEVSTKLSSSPTVADGAGW